MSESISPEPEPPRAGFDPLDALVEDRGGSPQRLSKPRLAWAALLGGSVLLAVAGQFYFIHRRDYLWDGVALYVGAFVLFAALVRWTEAPPGRGPSALGRIGRALVARRARLGLTLCALALSLFAGRLAVGQRAGADYTAPVLLWLAASALVVGAQMPRPRAWRRPLPSLAAWLRRYRWETLSVAFWLLLAGGVRFWQLAETPYPFSGDEANFAIESRRILQGELRNPFGTGWFSHPAMWFFLQSLFAGQFEPETLGVRIFSAIAGTLSVGTTYLLSRRLFGVGIAQLATALLAAYPFHIHYSRQALNNIGDACLAPLVLYLVYRAVERRDNLSWVLAGVALGAMQYGYFGARVVPVVVAAYLFWLLLAEGRAVFRHAAGVATFGVGAAVVAMPLILWYVAHPQDLTARLAVVGLFQSGWLAEEPGRTGKTVLQLLGEQVLKSVLAFNYYRDTGFHYHPPGPLLTFWTSVLFALGLCYGVLRLRDRPFALLVLWLGLALLFGSALTLNPPFSARLVVAAPAVCMLIALALAKVGETLGRVLDLQRATAMGVVAAVAALLVVADVRFYFEEYAPKPYYSDPNTEIGYLAGTYLAKLGDGYAVYFLGAPRMYTGHPTLVFFSGSAHTTAKHVGTDIISPLAPHERPPMVAGDSRLAFVLLPERMRELETLREFFPNGRTLAFDGRFGSGLFTVYQVD